MAALVGAGGPSDVTQPFGGSSPMSLDEVQRFRVVDFPAMQWDEDCELHELLPMSKVAAAPFGGLIAIVSDRDPFLVTVHNAAGVFINYFKLEHRIFNLFWNERKDHLIVLLEDGQVQFVATDGAMLYADVTLPSPPYAASTVRNGVVVYGQNGTLSLVYLRAQEYHHIDVNVLSYFEPDAPTCLLGISDDVSPSGEYEAVLASESDHSDVIRVEFRNKIATAEPVTSICDLILTFCAKSMALSFSGERIVIAGENGQIGCSTINMTDYHDMMIETPSREAPAFLSWVGEHTVAFVDALQLDEVHFFSPLAALRTPKQQPQLDYLTVPGDAAYIHEADGLRCISGMANGSTNRFFQVIPECATRVYYPFQQTRLPAALLRQAYDLHIRGSADSVTKMRVLTGGAVDDVSAQRLTVAINETLETAGFEFDAEQQKRLLRIASFAKGFCPTYDAAQFVLRCKRIRALRALRDPKVGMQLTMYQFERLPIERIARRLTDRRQFRLAFELTKDFGGVGASQVLSAWACLKIQAMLINAGVLFEDTGATDPNEDPMAARQLDDQIHAALRRNLANAPQLSFIPFAHEAKRLGRQHLFTRLLEQEPSVGNRVEALLDNGLADQALSQAVDTGNAELVFHCLIHLSASPKALFPKLAAICQSRRDTMAMDLAIQYVTVSPSRNADDMRHELMSIDPGVNMYLEMLQYFATQGKYRESDRSSRSSKYESMVRQCTSHTGAAIECCIEAQRVSVSNGKKDQAHEFEAAQRALEMQQRLLDAQTALVTDAADLHFLNLSVIATLQRIWETSVGRPEFTKKANEFARQFKVTDKQNQWAKLRAFAARNAPASILDLGGITRTGGKTNAGKTLLPPLAFIETLMKLGCNEQAALFVARLPRIEDRLEYYVQCHAWGEAAQECIKNRQPEMLDRLRSRASHYEGAVAMVNRVAGG